MTNKYNDHVIVIPEDDANRQIANGFIQEVSLKSRAIQILPPKNGWRKVLNSFEDNYKDELTKYSKMHLVLVIDFDDDFINRIALFQSKCPAQVQDRFYVIGTLSEPEELKRKSGFKFERIGLELASDCAARTQNMWSHALLAHNLAEVTRLEQNVRPFLF